MRVLIVDDHWEERAALRRILESVEHQIAEACNGAEAISLLSDDLPELIISDIFMPIIDGFMLCREVRRDPRSRHIPFLFHTATFTSQADEDLARQVGGSAFLRKPVMSEELLSVIHRLSRNDSVDDEQDIPQDVDRVYAQALFRKLIEKSTALDEMRLTLTNEEPDWPSILRGIRRTRGLKQAALGELLGIDQSRVSRWESGKESPNIGARKVLMDLLKAD